LLESKFAAIGRHNRAYLPVKRLPDNVDKRAQENSFTKLQRWHLLQCWKAGSSIGVEVTIDTTVNAKWKKQQKILQLTE
jgi:hypothetical protein